MRINTTRRLLLVWLLLVAATLASFELLSGTGIDPRLSAIGILAIACVKVRFVGREFMELRHAPRAMRWALDLWLLFCGGGLALFYIEGPNWAARGLLG